jgi:glycosyltransferase involved in cell wall biosynthesis
MSAFTPLRLLFLSAARRWTGGERCMVTVAGGLAKRGHAVVFAADPRGPVLERLDPPVRARPVRMRNDLDLAAIVHLRALARRHSIEAVCVNTFRELKLGGIAARLAGAAGVVNRMGMNGPLYDGRRERALYAALLDVLVRDSEWGCRRVRRENPWLASPILLARNGVDAAAIARVRPADRTELGAEPDETLVAVTGQGSAAGSPALAACLGAAAPRESRLRLVFLGDLGAAADAGIRRAVGSGSPVRLSLLGARRPEDALRILAACDLVARPSASDGTGFGVLEAMALEKPVVASAVGGLTEAVLDGETGRLIPIDEPEVMARALLDLAADPEMRRRLGRAARERVSREFTEARMIDAYEAALRLAAARGRPSPASRTVAQASAAARSQLK